MKSLSFWQVGLICLPLLFASCATTPDKKPGKDKEAASGKDDAKDDKDKDSDKSDSESASSGSSGTFIYSLSNNNLTSFTVNTSKAKSLADDIEGKLKNPTIKDRKDLVALMAAKRLAGEGVVPVFQVAKRLMIVEMKDNIKRSTPEVAMLELALASIQSKQIPMANHWIGKLLQSKNPKTKAAALTAQGMIALLDNRLPEAVAFWNEALKVKSDYEPARLNIGFSALRYGDAKTAKSMLSGMGQDWFVQTGLMQAERLSDNAQEAASLCKSILEKKPNYKPALYSCALNEYQGLGNLAKARLDLEHVAKAGGGPSSIDEKTFLILGKIEKELNMQQQKEGAAKAAAAAAAAKSKAGAPPGAGAPAAPAAVPAK
ncbi:MAG: hypothetical protein H7249_09780 [Chitinophagaceae bacterium]|nr:hypothetical protein [Oligoflexus sp.]